MFKCIKKEELFEFGGRHFISENFMRMQTSEMIKNMSKYNFTPNSYELLVVVLKGKGALITPNSYTHFNEGDQVYVINADIKFSADTDLELELVYLPGPGAENHFILKESRIVYLSKADLIESNCRLFIEEIYGKIKVIKLKNNTYSEILENQKELLIICLEGSCQVSVVNHTFELNQGDQVYLKNELLNLTVSNIATLEFIYAPTETYIKLSEYTMTST